MSHGDILMKLRRYKQWIALETCDSIVFGSIPAIVRLHVQSRQSTIGYVANLSKVNDHRLETVGMGSLSSKSHSWWAGLEIFLK